MNMLLWGFQILLALHTAIGAVWKISHSPEQTMPSLKAIPQSVWLGLSVFEILLSVGLVLPAFSKSWAVLVPIAALGIAVEMLLFCGIHVGSGENNYAPMIYWIVVAALCVFLAYGRITLSPF